MSLFDAGSFPSALGVDGASQRDVLHRPAQQELSPLRLSDASRASTLLAMPTDLAVSSCALIDVAVGGDGPVAFVASPSGRVHSWDGVAAQDLGFGCPYLEAAGGSSSSAGVEAICVHRPAGEGKVFVFLLEVQDDGAMVAVHRSELLLVVPTQEDGLALQYINSFDGNEREVLRMHAYFAPDHLLLTTLSKSARVSGLGVMHLCPAPPGGPDTGLEPQVPTAVATLQAIDEPIISLGFGEGFAAAGTVGGCVHVVLLDGGSRVATVAVPGPIIGLHLWSPWIVGVPYVVALDGCGRVFTVGPLTPGDAGQLSPVANQLMPSLKPFRRLGPAALRPPQGVSQPEGAFVGGESLLAVDGGGSLQIGTSRGELVPGQCLASAVDQPCTTDAAIRNGPTCWTTVANERGEEEVIVGTSGGQAVLCAVDLKPDGTVLLSQKGSLWLSSPVYHAFVAESAEGLPRVAFFGPDESTLWDPFPPATVLQLLESAEGVLT